MLFDEFLKLEEGDLFVGFHDRQLTTNQTNSWKLPNGLQSVGCRIFEDKDIRRALEANELKSTFIGSGYSPKTLETLQSYHPSIIQNFRFFHPNADSFKNHLAHNGNVKQRLKVFEVDKIVGVFLGEIIMLQYGDAYLEILVRTLFQHEVGWIELFTSNWRTEILEAI